LSVKEDYMSTLEPTTEEVLKWFNGIKNTSSLVLPDKVLVLSDIHAAAGDEYDPLKISQKESEIIDLLQEAFSKGYFLFASEFWDVWRGYDLSNIYGAHKDLFAIVDQYQKANRLYTVISNHNLDLFLRPDYLIFKGFGKQIFFDHGHRFDFYNDAGWQIGREAVRIADKLGLDFELAPHPAKSNPDRHSAVRGWRQALADANKDWEFHWGHTHYFEDVGNNHNDGSPLSGQYGYYIEKGVTVPIKR
jgi:hypothetical protein